eukprot:1222858-Prorocentrum_lima.AAC.1
MVEQGQPPKLRSSHSMGLLLLQMHRSSPLPSYRSATICTAALEHTQQFLCKARGSMLPHH